MNSSRNFTFRSANTYFSLVICALIAALATPTIANAGVVSIWVNDQVSGWQQIATDPTGNLANIGTYTTLNGAFKLTNSYASMADGSSTPALDADLNSSTFHLQHIGNGSDLLQIAVIGTGFTGPTKSPVSVRRQVSGANILGSLTALTFQSYVDSKNNGNPALLTGGQGPQNPPIYPTISGGNANQDSVIITDLSSPFSVAHRFDLVMTGDGQIVSLGGDTSLTGSFFAPVPEPSSVVLICICATSLGGYSWRRRNRQKANADATIILDHAPAV